MTGDGPESRSTPSSPESGKEGRGGRWEPLVLGLLVVLMVQFFLSSRVFLPSPHTGGDNAGYITLAHSILDRGAYRELWDPQEPVHTKYPPVFPILLAGAMALGAKGWVGLKVVPFLSTLLAGLFTFLWVRGRSGVIMGLGVALLLALSDGVLYYSRWILSDPVFLALTLGALWALERGEGGGDSRAPPPGLRRGWLGVGIALVILAYFTRSAGLPLVVATALWLILRRWWRVLGVFVPAFLLPAGLWWVRGRMVGGSEYISEFWLLDPYRPELGKVGPGTLLLRVWENLLAYATDLVPEGIVGLESPPLLLVLGLLISILALLGWLRSMREGPGVAELFMPLYAGLMFLWPQVWSGDRFALPLIPLLLFFAGKALLGLLGRVASPLRVGVLGVAFLSVALPAGWSWLQEVRSADACRILASGGDPWACQPLTVREYVLIAEWAGENLPAGAAVVTRKPRIFYLLSGVKTLSLPLTSDAEVFLATARDKDARYLTLDRWDSLAGYYLFDVLEARPEAFCTITGVEVGGEPGIQLLGIREGSGSSGEEGLRLPQCPMEMLATEPRGRAPLDPGSIPLLVMEDR